MAIDTATKRSSVQAYTFGLTRPVPDGTIATGDRAHAAWLYSGHSYSGAVAEAERKNQRWNLRGGFGRQALKGRSGYRR